jgi:hypothetical protein
LLQPHIKEAKLKAFERLKDVVLELNLDANGLVRSFVRRSLLEFWDVCLMMRAGIHGGE